MSIDKSLKRKNTLVRTRSVYTRAERIKILMDEDRWKAEQGPYGLPKVKTLKLKKAKKAAKEEKAEGEEAAAASATPAAGAKKEEKKK
jgi:small basic protein (TIGR04137 family)